MSVEKKNPLKRDQALNDATSGQMGEEPRSEPKPQPLSDSQNTDLREKIGVEELAAKCLERSSKGHN